MRYRLAVGLVLLLTLAACATPQVDQTIATFSETEFTSDLNNCRGGTFIVASAKTVGFAMLGSAYGAIEGAYRGARHGDSAEGAAIGAVLGGTIGLTAGALEAVQKYEAEIAGCLTEKGYQVAG